MSMGSARNELSEGLLVQILADCDMGEFELQAVFLTCKAAKPSVRAFAGLLASNAVMIFPSGSQLRSEFPRNHGHVVY
jgi:hypothetical protein